MLTRHIFEESKEMFISLSSLLIIMAITFMLGMITAFIMMLNALARRQK